MSQGRQSIFSGARRRGDRGATRRIEDGPGNSARPAGAMFSFEIRRRV